MKLTILGVVATLNEQPAGAPDLRHDLRRRLHSLERLLELVSSLDVRLIGHSRWRSPAELFDGDRDPPTLTIRLGRRYMPCKPVNRRHVQAAEMAVREMGGLSLADAS